MIRHYLMVAFRNMRKYRSQTLISIAGLAVGFTCFALSALWIRYEMTYDGFHKNANQIYSLSTPSDIMPTGYANYNPYPLAAYLKETFPEVEEACNISINEAELKIDDVDYPIQMAFVDSAFLNMFSIRIIEGNMDFVIPENGKAAITEEKSKSLFPGENPLGKRVFIPHNREYTICAVVAGWSKHSNYPFEILFPLWASSSE